MILPEKWNKKNYQEFVNNLKSLQDKEYKEFHQSLVMNSQYEMIGIRVPIMKNIAKEIAKKTNSEEFLIYAQDKYYEEIMIQGLVIAQMKEEEVFYRYWKNFISKIDNWAICDTFCSSSKIVKKYEEKYFKEAIRLSLSPKEFVARVGLVTILDHFVHEENIATIFQTLNQITSDCFYINMAEAWLICELYIRFPEKTFRFLSNNSLNAFTQNKAISKIHDSYRVSEKEKQQLKKLKK